MVGRMPWTFEFGAPDPLLGLDGDAVGWVWHLENDELETEARVEVVITRDAIRSQAGKEAVESEGESLVTDVEDWATPPSRITLRSDGVSYDGGQRGGADRST